MNQFVIAACVIACIVLAWWFDARLLGLLVLAPVLAITQPHLYTGGDEYLDAIKTIESIYTTPGREFYHDAAIFDKIIERKYKRDITQTSYTPQNIDISTPEIKFLVALYKQSSEIPMCVSGHVSGSFTDGNTVMFHPVLTPYGESQIEFQQNLLVYTAPSGAIVRLEADCISKTYAIEYDGWHHFAMQDKYLEDGRKSYTATLLDYLRPRVYDYLKNYIFDTAGKQVVRIYSQCIADMKKRPKYLNDMAKNVQQPTNLYRDVLAASTHVNRDGFYCSLGDLYFENQSYNNIIRALYLGSVDTRSSHTMTKIAFRDYRLLLFSSKWLINPAHVQQPDSVTNIIKSPISSNTAPLQHLYDIDNNPLRDAWEYDYAEFIKLIGDCFDNLCSQIPINKKTNGLNANDVIGSVNVIQRAIALLVNQKISYLRNSLVDDTHRRLITRFNADLIVILTGIIKKYDNTRYVKNLMIN